MAFICYPDTMNNGTLYLRNFTLLIFVAIFQAICFAADTPCRWTLDLSLKINKITISEQLTPSDRPPKTIAELLLESGELILFRVIDRAYIANTYGEYSKVSKHSYWNLFLEDLFTRNSLEISSDELKDISIPNSQRLLIAAQKIYKPSTKSLYEATERIKYASFSDQGEDVNLALRPSHKINEIGFSMNAFDLSEILVPVSAENVILDLPFIETIEYLENNYPDVLEEGDSQRVLRAIMLGITAIDGLRAF